MNLSTRNYAVLHIPPQESRVFVTKERAPYLICVEVFRPEEISQYAKKKNALNNLFDDLKSTSGATTEQDNPYLAEEKTKKGQKKKEKKWRQTMKLA